MNDETMKLARELRDLVPLRDQRWDGARFVSETSDEAFRVSSDPAYVDGHVHTHGTVDDWSPAPDDLVPDLDDAPTRACVLEMAREAFSAPDFSPRLTAVGWQAFKGGAFYPTEMAAAVAALREAKRHE